MMSRTEITIHTGYKSLAPFVEHIHQEFAKGGKTIYKQRNEIKVFEVDGLIVNVKRFMKPLLPNRFIYTFFRPSKAERAYRYAILLEEKEINTPTPIALVRIYSGGLLSFSYFISRQEVGYETMYRFGHIPLAGNENIVKAFARYTAAMHLKEVYHKDYSPGNILYKETEDGIKFSIVDINRMHFGPVSVEEGCASFARLWGQDDFFELLAHEYAAARNADTQQCLQWVLAYRRKFWKRYTRKHEMPFKLVSSGTH